MALGPHPQRELTLMAYARRALALARFAMAAGAPTRPFRGEMSRHMTDSKPLVGIIMGSKSDLEFGVAHETRVMSAHRSPALTVEYATTASKRGLEVIVAAAGGAAHLAGVVAAHTVLPVIGVPIQSALNGLDSLLSTVQMPKGVPVATVAIGPAGAANAGLLAVAILATARPDLRQKLQAFRDEMAAEVARNSVV
jgi:5-(carboxyamino)imidazole ribonucleotide mutase